MSKVKKPFMTDRRYSDLMKDPESSLTPNEILHGWHFCADWDCLLIHKSWREYECCTCYSN